MGSGTISYKKLPKKGKLYGTTKFHLVPKLGHGKGDYYFAVRPETDSNLLAEGYKYQIEGEFSTGEYSYRSAKKDIRAGLYDGVRYIFYKEEISSMNLEQRKAIEKWLIEEER